MPAVNNTEIISSAKDIESVDTAGSGFSLSLEVQDVVQTNELIVKEVNSILSYLINTDSNYETSLEKGLKERGVGERPIILLINELIPLKDKYEDTNDSIDNVTINFGEENTLKVTNIVRLIELQNILNKQINKLGSDFIIKEGMSPFFSNSEVKQAFNLNIGNDDENESKLLDYLKLYTDQLYRNIVSEISNNFTSYFSFNKTKTQAINDVLDKVLPENSNNSARRFYDSDFLYLLVNLALNNLYIQKIKDYYFNLKSLNEEYQNLLNFYQLPKNLNQNFNSFSPLFSDIQEEITNYTSNQYEKYVLGNNFNNEDIASKNNMSNFLNLTARLVGQSKFLDTRSADNNYAQSNLRSFSVVKFSNSNDLYNAIEGLKTIRLVNLINKDNRHSSNKDKFVLNSAYLENILNLMQGSYSSKISELLTAICFDQVIGANLDYDESIDQNLMQLFGETFYGISNSEIVSGEQSLDKFVNYIDSNSNLNLLLNYLFKEVNNGEDKTVPFEFKESTFLEIYENITKDSFSYYVLSAVEKGNLTFPEAKEFLIGKKEKLKMFIEKFTKLFSLGFDSKGGKLEGVNDFALKGLNPLSYLNFYIQQFHDDLSEEIKDVQGIKNYSARLLLSVTSANNFDALIESFKSSFLGALSDARHQSPYLYGQNENTFIDFFGNSVITDEVSSNANNESQTIEDETVDIVYNSIMSMLKEESYRNHSSLFIKAFANSFPILNKPFKERYVYRSNKSKTYPGLQDIGFVIDFGGEPGMSSYNQIAGSLEFLQNNSLTNISFGQYSGVAGLSFFSCFDNWALEDDEPTPEGLKHFIYSIFGGNTANRILFGDNQQSQNNPGAFDGTNQHEQPEHTKYTDWLTNDGTNYNQNTADNQIDNISGKAIDRLTGLHLSSKGGLEHALLFNKGILNNANNSITESTFKSPEIADLSDEESKILTKRGYFSPVGQIKVSEMFKANNGNALSSNGPLQTTNLHMYLVFYMLIFHLIKKTQPMGLGYDKSTHSIVIRFSPPRIKGMLDGLVREDKGTENDLFDFLTNLGYNVEDDITNNYNAYKKSFNSTKNIIGQVRNTIHRKNKQLLKCLHVFQSQLQKIEEFINILNNFGNTNDPFLTRDISITASQNPNIDLENFIETSSLNHIIRSHYEKFALNSKIFPMPISNQIAYSDVDLKIMYKVLTSPNYGYLKSEKFGKKLIFHVGITQLTLNNLYKSLGEKSNLICLIVERKNSINTAERTFPKYFIFDTSKYIFPSYIDYESNDKRIVESNHILNFLQEDNLQNTINSIEFLELSGGILKSAGIGKDALFKNSGIGQEIIINNYSENVKQEILTELQYNHIIDYYLKLYTKTTIEVEAEEEKFPLRPSLNLENTIDNDTRTIEFYNKLKNSVKNKVESLSQPEEDTIKQNSRIEKIIKTSPLLNSNARAENAYLNTSTFARNFSFLINSDDFVIDNENSVDDPGYRFGAKLTNNESALNVAEDSIYSYTIKVGILKRW